MNIRFVIRMAVAVAFTVISGLNAAAQQMLPPLFHKDHHLIVIAHRGDCEHVPENTLAAYKQAIKCGADYVEIDLRTTKDGHLVIMHDATVNRMTRGKGAVNNLTYDEVKKMKIEGKDRKTYSVPDFGSVLKTCKGHINIYLDFKEANVQRTYDLIKKYGMQHHVVVYLNHEEQYGEWKGVAPEMPLMASLPEKMSFQQLDSLLNKKEINIVDNANRVDEIRFLHQKRIQVWKDVESDHEGAAVWQKMLNDGVDGMQTDHPEELIGYLEQKGLR